MAHTPARRHLARFAGFSLLPACSLLASLTLLPLISRNQGGAGWVALGVGQGTGAVVGVIAGLAWPTIGGHAVAKAATPDARLQIFVESVYSRLLALCALLPISTLACALLVERFQTATILFMIGTALNSMSASWYYAGLGAPSRLVINEGVVRLGGYAFAAVALASGAPLATYGALTVLAGILSLSLNWTHIVGWTMGRTAGLLKVSATTVYEHRLGTLSRVGLSAFAYGGTPIFTAISPASLAVFAALDQLQRATSNATAVLPQTFVAWVSGDMAHARRRGRFLVILMTVVSVVILAIWVAAGPLIVDFLFSGQAQVDRFGCLLVGFYAAISLVGVTYQLLVMIPLGLENLLFKVNLVGAICGVSLLAALSALGDPYLAFSTWSIMGAVALPIMVYLTRRHGGVQATAAGEADLFAGRGTHL